HYSKGGIILGEPERLKSSLTPLIVLTIDSVASGSSSIFSSISVPSLQKMSLKYNCSIIDTSHYEVIILKGGSKTCRVNSIQSTLKQFDEKFFNEAFDLITEFQRDKRIEFEKPSLEILYEIFPNFKNIISLENNVSNEDETSSELGLESEMDKQLEINQVAEIIDVETHPLSLEEKEETIETETEIEAETETMEETEEEEERVVNPNAETDRKMLKEVLLCELDYSLENFLSASKNLYKKAIENILQKSYGIKVDKFLKLVLYFCDKQEIPFFFPSHSYLLKIIEFIDVELPSSSDIENYVERLTEDYVTVRIPEELKEHLEQFLDKKYANESTNLAKVSSADETKMASIPAPPAKEENNSVLNGVE
ncbi:MAG: hypothetical protein KGD64_14020, partial [Candidatus Heimdallarchaeota archaeon]|nr:hypothetical protein [Candidatus Heimdallarchaeota archaeon]